MRVVYKPVAGERPLWDFPDGTLAGREVASYAVSEALGWNVVPHTFLRDGPHGLGMVQRWQEPDDTQAAVDLVPEGRVPTGWLHVFDGVDEHDRGVALVHEDTEPVRRMAVFDVARQQRGPQGRARAGDDRRAPLRRRPRRHLPRREQAAHRALGLDGGAPDHRGARGGRGRPRRRHRRPRRAAGGPRDPAGGGGPRRSVRTTAAATTMPDPGGAWPVIPWPPF